MQKKSLLLFSFPSESTLSKGTDKRVIMQKKSLLLFSFPSVCNLFATYLLNFLKLMEFRSYRSSGVQTILPTSAYWRKGDLQNYCLNSCNSCTPVTPRSWANAKLEQLINDGELVLKTMITSERISFYLLKPWFFVSVFVPLCPSEGVGHQVPRLSSFFYGEVNRII